MTAPADAGFGPTSPRPEPGFEAKFNDLVRALAQKIRPDLDITGGDIRVENELEYGYYDDASNHVEISWLPEGSQQRVFIAQYLYLGDFITALDEVSSPPQPKWIVNVNQNRAGSWGWACSCGDYKYGSRAQPAAIKAADEHAREARHHVTLTTWIGQAAVEVTTDEVNATVDDVNEKIAEYNKTALSSIAPASPWVEYRGE